MEQQTVQRPSFLTVLCILTFIGSGLGVLRGILGLIGTSILPAFMVTQGTMLVQLIGLGACALCLTGAIQMWSLKKQGFTLYVVGSLLGIAGSLISYMSVSAALSAFDRVGGANVFQGAAITGIVIGIAINLGFVAMYNANKKYLVN